jgi:transcriptional regulator with XRE-family HTH domain
MSSQGKCDFAVMARSLRILHRKKQREVAVAIGIQPSTYGNVESSSFKIIRRERVDDLSRLYKLDAAQHSALVAAWEAAPISEYSKKQRDGWAKRNEARSKGKLLDKVRTALCDLLDAIASSAAAGEPCPSACSCVAPDAFVDEPGRTCELCSAFHALGFPDGFVSPDVAAQRIADVSPVALNERPVVPNTPHVPNLSTGSPESH